jgi:peptidoglycan-associated lipoprotein
LTEDELFSRKTLQELNAEMPLGDVFFDYDMSAIRDDARPILQRNADYLRRWMSTRVSIEGHADSRGTAEYNLALGERRASSVRDYLVSLGIAADRMLPVSRGEESPQCTEENEACWQRNRRGRFVFTAK